MHVSFTFATKKNNGKFARCFHSILPVFKRGYLEQISHIDGKEWLIGIGYIAESVTGHIANETGQLSVLSIHYSGSSIFSTAGPLLLTDPVLLQEVECTVAVVSM